jgi:A/G-specific adenine glycosylase
MRASQNPVAGKPEWQSLFRRRLLRWYQVHKRDLPWRGTRDPYQVWLSEIMLQQTRVSAVLGYYQRFVKRFPDIQALASARLPSVLAVWSGLGYYRRARMLHAAAKKVLREYGRKFPHTTEQLLTLPGIGRYTAAAIASMAFDEPVAAVDGNVERVLRRLHGRPLSGAALWQAATQLLSKRHPGDFNQAMMELGATVCLPRNPACVVCPVNPWCASRGARAERHSGSREKRRIFYALDCRPDSVFLVRRPKSASLMPGMWELPEISAANEMGKGAMNFRHSITVTDYRVRVARQPVPRQTDGRWVPRNRLQHLPLTGLARKILRTANLI